MQHETQSEIDLPNQIQEIFDGGAFQRPLFYNYGGGLRFELSESGSTVQMFLQAINKATAICADIFDADSEIMTCLSIWIGNSRFSVRPSLLALRQLGIKIPRERWHWADPVDEEDSEGWRARVAFQLPASELQSLLWIACASDFPTISPRPQCSVHLFNLAKKILVFPYDDRGMDVVGPNHELLASLYRKHNELLLDHDRDRMRATFEGPQGL
jgi:hypothetical protein